MPVIRTVFADAAQKHPNALFAKVNTQDEQELAAHFNIRSIPTLMILRDNIIVFSEAGALAASALEQVLDSAQALDMHEVRREIDTQAPSDEPTLRRDAAAEPRALRVAPTRVIPQVCPSAHPIYERLRRIESWRARICATPTQARTRD